MRRKIFTFSLTLLLLTAYSLRLPAPALAQGTSAWSGVCVADEIAGGEDVATIQGLQCLIANVFSVGITIIGLAAFVMFIVGSWKWLLGGTKGPESARSTMTYAVVGIVVALSAFVILNLLAEFTGVQTITEFVIPSSDTQF